MKMESDEHPWARRKLPVIDLVRGQRISIAGRKGTFWGYYQIRSFGNVIEWYPDNNNFEPDVTIWTQGGILVSEWDEKDSLTEEENDFGMWEAEL
jgi:hypothetical protein